MNGGPFGDQLSWLKNDLINANGNRDKVPWIFVSGHRPFYSSSCADGCWPQSKPYFEPLFNSYNVDIVFWGHIHWYERMFPIELGGNPQSGYINPTAPIYLLPAAPGNVEGLTTGGITTNYTAFISNKVFGLGLLTVVNSTNLEWNFYQSDTQELLDSIDIIQTKGRKDMNKKNNPNKQGITEQGNVADLQRQAVLQ